MIRRKRNEKLGLKRPAQGFTLVELLVVVVVVGILGAVAFPSYRQYSLRAQRTEAKTALLRLAANQARFYLQNNTYTNDVAALGFSGGSTEKGLYTLAVPVADANTYQATAVPTVGGGLNGVDMHTDVDCTLFRITAQGARTATPDPDTNCW